MSRTLSLRKETLPLALLALLLAMLVFEVWFLRFGAATPAQSQTEELNVADTADLTLDSSTAGVEFRTILERPLFTMSRRPTRYVPPVTEETPLKAKWVLSAIIANGDQTFALFADTAANQRSSLGPGMLLEDWRITSINRTQVVLVRGNQSETFNLNETAGRDVNAGTPPSDTSP